MLTRFQEKFNSVFSLIAKFFHKLGITPTQVSFLGFLFAVCAAYSFYFFNTNLFLRWLALIFLIFSSLFDAIDGALARSYSMVTRFGGIIDSVLDRIAEILIYSSLILAKIIPVYIGLFVLASSLMISYIRSRAEIEGISLKSKGIAERPERLIILIGATLLNQLYVGIIVICILNSITIIQRIWIIHKFCMKGNSIL